MIKIEDVEPIITESQYHPEIARKKMLELIDITLDNKNEKEFHILSGLLLTLSK